MRENTLKPILNAAANDITEPLNPQEPPYLEPLSNIDNVSKEDSLIADAFLNNDIIAEIWAKKRMDFSLNVAKKIMRKKHNLNDFMNDLDGFAEKNPSFVQSISKSIGHDTNTTIKFLSESVETFKRIKQTMRSTTGTPHTRVHSAIGTVTEEFSDEIMSLFDESPEQSKKTSIS